MISHEAGALHSDVVNRPGWLKVPDDVNALADGLWPAGVRREPAGELSVQGVGVGQLAAEFGTPAYVVDEDDFRARARAFRDAFAAAAERAGTTSSVYYASKAFSCHQVAGWVRDEGLGIDVSSEGELAVARSADFPAARITLHGNNKSDAEIAAAAAGQVGKVVLDCASDVDRLGAAAQAAGSVVPVMVRVTVGVEAHTHSFIATAHEDQKFGLSLADGEARDVALRAHAHPHLELRGLHTHIGSQIFDVSGFEVAIARLCALRAQVSTETGTPLPDVNIGGGYGIRYTLAHRPLTPSELALRLVTAMVKECSLLDVPVPTVSAEPGRAIAGPAAFTLYRVGVVKPIQLDDGSRRHYVSVDGGMSDNIRTALYGADYSATLAGRVSDAPPALARVVGKHCESGDIVVMDEFLPSDIGPGDLLAVPGTGAYCRSMASNYNHAPRPPVVAVRSGEARTIVRRENVQDLLRLDVR